MNSCQKGKRGERAWRDVLREEGYVDARRGQQFSGSPDSPDVVCESLSFLHFEVKCVEKLNLQDAVDQAKRDCGNKLPVVAHKRNHCGWNVTMPAGVFFKILRGDLPIEFEPKPDATISGIFPALDWPNVKIIEMNGMKFRRI